MNAIDRRIAKPEAAATASAQLEYSLREQARRVAFILNRDATSANPCEAVRRIALLLATSR